MTHFASPLLSAGPALLTAASPFAGGWDLTITPNSGRTYPDWMELSEAGGKPRCESSPRSGGARQIPDFQVTRVAYAPGVFEGRCEESRSALGC